ncbi:hypothetical protein J437_LFUL006931 [Ladona fulva]|uniref:Uncharacterized protein n=1 Tax=Ladona fulva TaxID=123851 RepID=A0A8K0KAF1_LADFU|nr:hypothetical protein J437_LFUL006931 [Ladona fulva]
MSAIDLRRISALICSKQMKGRIEFDQDGLMFLIIFNAAYVSYGGLLMRLQGDANNLHGFEVDQNFFSNVGKVDPAMASITSLTTPVKSVVIGKKIPIRINYLRVSTDWAHCEPISTKISSGKVKEKSKRIRVGGWNVRSILKEEKLENLRREVIKN